MESEGRAGEIEADELRDLIEHVLSELDADDSRGSLLQASGLRVRFEITDLDLVLRVRAAESGGHHLSWAFEEDSEIADSGLTLAMDSVTVNGYLQGRESLAVAVARGRVRCSGDLRTTLVCLPALRLLVKPYRSWVARLHPHLALT